MRYTRVCLSVEKKADDALMLARSKRPRAHEQLGSLWLRWRVVVTQGLELVGAGRTPAGRSAGATSSTPSAASGWIGVAALALGAAGSVALAWPGTGRSDALLAAGANLTWAGLRLLVMTAVLRSRFRRVLGPWGVGCVPFALGVDPVMRLAAWVVSAPLTAYALTTAGYGRRRAWLAVGSAWGLQAAFVVTAILMQNLLVIGRLA